MTAPDPPLGPRGLALRAGTEGRAAGLNGDLPGACPYPAARPFTRRAWFLGYVAGRREARTLPTAAELDADPGAPAPNP